MREYSVGKVLTANTLTTIYKVPTGYYAKWNLCYVVNHTGNNKTIDAIWYDLSEDASIYVLDGYSLSPTNFIKFDGGAWVILEEGDEIRMLSETGSTMHTINSFELIKKSV